jgi:DNA-binding transcriptional MerR regulator
MEYEMKKSGNDAVKLNISEVAARYEVTPRTLRFYEKRGLLAPERIGTQRLFGAAVLKRLEFILKVRVLGFTLTEIGDMLGDEAEGPSQASALPSEMVASQITYLMRQRSRLDDAIAILQRDFIGHAPVETSGAEGSRL